MRHVSSRIAKYALLSFVVFFVACGTKKHTEPAIIPLENDWQIQSSANLDQKGSSLSTPDTDTREWQSTPVPSTVLAALVRNNVYQDIFMGDNFDKIPKEPFTVPWWYRTSFTLDEVGNDNYYNLVFEGINYRANVWLNGQQVASSDTMEQSFRMFDFAISDKVKQGENVLAVEIIPPVNGDLTIGWVDWNPWPADNNMGIWRPVKLLKTGAVGMKNVFVKPSLNTETLAKASLT
ncbi:MAG: beta galactosidase jelly roll domain-containing protein, partial [Cyclobacteriaceae bacterium]|nr:beta galactosidase jelly roll domain-containing protein [Cyclobacteriaceae bacterium]